ncbi:MAG: hypothetical protein QOC95_2509 [Thermoleophilaceae bacterium]|jgi:uncharacterized protein with FMN-binding domain|nr:hypothetical protein [Thermoleophilaceae bacterium]
MRRAPIVLSATVAGVAGVLSFHTQPQKLTPAPSSTVATTKATTKATAGTASRTSATSGTKTATGAVAQNQYGNVQVKVTVANGKIKQVTAIQLPQSDPKSAEISQYAAPQLQSEVLAAQSSKIDGVSGASYTSQSYDTSLQSALDQLGYQA